MRAHKYKYKNEWDNESLTEHNLTYHSSDAARRCRGSVDFTSPSRIMMQAESSPQDDAVAIWEDAQDCSRKLNLLLITRKASEPVAIHRANANAGLMIFTAIQYYCEGKSQRAIGDMIGKRHAVADRYIDRFTSWSAKHCSGLINKISPESVIELCEPLTSSQKTLADVLDEFRKELTDLFCDLAYAAVDLENRDAEVYTDLARFQKTPGRTINVPVLLNTI